VAVKVAILDDWFDTLRTLACFEKLAGHTVTVFTDHVQDTGLLAERLAGFDALVLIRERTEIRAALPLRTAVLSGFRRSSLSAENAPERRVGALSPATVVDHAS
jgi:hypothetical protein